ncbi:amidohydrolase family protein [Anoxybacterium hadale]|uniref:amidohydrolase family protein n=1 Tax=Anoxybacterium hadale TaxID=3408580 RepID=UPI003B00C7AF
MAFGFFRKTETADIIFMGGKIYTQNTDMPWTEAVACKNGLILALGDYEDIKELEGKHTKIVDLAGGFMLPGLIETSGHPVLDTFKNSCLFLKKGTFDETLSQISEYAGAQTDSEIIFAYGYEESIFESLEQDKASEALDEICQEKPVVVLGKSGLHCWLNTLATETVKAAAAEDEITTISLAYLLHVLEPFHSDIIPKEFTDGMLRYCKKGFTSVFDCGAPEYFTSIYQGFMVHAYQENMVKNRFFGSLLVTRDINPAPMIRKLSQYRTHCVELNEHVNFSTLKLLVDRTPGAVSITDSALREFCLLAADNGFDIHIDAIGGQAVAEAVEALQASRSAGYKKSAFTVAHDKDADNAALEHTSLGTDIKETPRTYEREGAWIGIQRAATITEALDLLTVDGAIQLGIIDSFGTIEKGKHADFAVFDKDPFGLGSIEALKELQAVMTVIDGKVVYDAAEDNSNQWHLMLTPQDFEFDE